MAYGVSKFQRGSGVFTCQCCQRKTRATNRDHAQTGNCEICFELAGIENAFSDYGVEESYNDYAVEARAHLAKLAKLGGDMAIWADLVALLDGEAARLAAPVAEPTTAPEGTLPQDGSVGNLIGVETAEPVASVTFGSLPLGGSFRIEGGDGLWIKVSKSSAKLLSRRLNPISGTRTKFAADLVVVLA